MVNAKMAGHVRLTKILLALITAFTLLKADLNALTMTSATLTISVDDCFAAYINGNLVYDTGRITSGQPWNTVYTFNLLSPVNYMTKCGDNVLAINYYDTMGTQTRVTYKLSVSYDNGAVITVYSDGNGNTRQIMDGYSPSQTFPAGWNTVGFDDSAWTDTIYICDATGNTYNSIPDSAFTGGWVPYIGYNSGCWLRSGDINPSNLLRQRFVLPCPNVNITKSINKGVFNLGETITYCFYVTNTDTASATFSLWDTLPAVTTFAGCDHGCVTGTSGAGTVVTWAPLTVASGASLQVCLWAIASAYPYIPGIFEKLAFNDTRGGMQAKRSFCSTRQPGN